MTKPVLDVPSDMKRQNPWAIIVMAGLATLSFILAANTLVSIAVMIFHPAV